MLSDMHVDDSYRRLIQGQKYLEPEQERRLLEESKSTNPKVAEAARNQIILSHLRLAMKLAIQTAKKTEGCVLTVTDLLQEAIVGLCYALNKFDLNEHVRFATYASYWVKAYLSDHAHAHSYQLKYSLSNDAKTILKNYARIFQQNRNKQLSDKELHKLIAEQLGVSEFVVGNISKTALTRNKPIELDRTFFSETGEELSNDIPDEGPLPEDIVAGAMSSDYIRKQIAIALGKLNHRDRSIIEERYLSEEPATLDMLGEKWGVSKERIRQLEHRALGILKMELQELVDA